MPSITSLLQQCKTAFPDYRFVPDDDFRWDPRSRTIHYAADAPDADSYLLHELSHALLGHRAYRSDIELLALERDAWQYAAATLGPRFERSLDDDLVQDSLDTYRDWLHARSTCPKCSATGLQSSARIYHCISCNHDWKVNEARACRLLRTNTSSS